jgi:hypothetical protein
MSKYIRFKGDYKWLKKMGYKFEYAHNDGGDRTEVWLNQDARMCVRIEWMKIDEEGWRLKGPALKGRGMPSNAKSIRIDSIPNP